jgi:hypothetical protein
MYPPEYSPSGGLGGFSSKAKLVVNFQFLAFFINKHRAASIPKLNNKHDIPVSLMERTLHPEHLDTV